jgi:cell wall-associated NlpC family hydrolase
MSREIKTKPMSRTPKEPDMATRVPKELMRRGLAEAKDKLATQEPDSTAQSGSPENYATDKAQEGMDAAARKTGDMMSDAAGSVKDRINRHIKGRDEKADTQGEYRAEHDTPRDARSPANPNGLSPERIRRQSAESGKRRVQQMARERRALRGAGASSSASNTAESTAWNTVKNSAKTTPNDTVKTTAKGAVKTTKKSIKATQKTVKATKKSVKTAQKAIKTAAKTAQKTAKAAQQVARAAAQAAAKAAVTAAKATVKAVAMMIKLFIAAIKGLIAAIAAGGWVVIVVILVIGIIALILGSAFGIFFSGEPDVGNSMTVSEAVVEISDDFQVRIQSRIDALISQDTYDEVQVFYGGDIDGDSDIPNNWNDVITAYAAKMMGDGYEALSFDEERMAILREIFFDMNKISIRSEVITEEISASDPADPNAASQEKKILKIYVTVNSLGYEQGASLYGFNRAQLEIADEMMSPDYYSLFAELLGINLTGGADLQNICSNLPAGSKGAAIVEAALTRLGHPYSQDLRGTKNYVDCSYFAWWAYNQAGVFLPSTSVTQAKYCYDNGYNIGKSELQPGDLVFWSKLSCNCGRWNEIHHVGVYIGDGMTIEARAGKGRVVINTLWGENGAAWRIHSYARPYAYN